MNAIQKEHAEWVKDEYAKIARNRRRSRRALILARGAILLSLLAVPWQDADGNVLPVPLLLPPWVLFWLTGGLVSVVGPVKPMLGLLLTEWLGCFLLAWVAGWQPAESARRVIQRFQQFFNTPAPPP